MLTQIQESFESLSALFLRAVIERDDDGTRLRRITKISITRDSGEMKTDHAFGRGTIRKHHEHGGFLGRIAVPPLLDDLE